MAWLRCLPISTVAVLAPVLTAKARAEVEVVRDGRPVAVIVIADQSTAVSRYAAQELAYHVERATGAKLSITTESAAPTGSGPRLYLGNTRAARLAGIAVERLAPETFVLRTAENVLYLAGNDAGGDPLDPNTFAGTLLGVYEWLETDLGVRWLWPGALGTYVPKTSTVGVRSADRNVSPRFIQRNVRGGLTFKGEHAALGFTRAAAEEYAREQAIFLRRHRMGKSVRLSYGHAFTDWWQKYGAGHPGWFPRSPEEHEWFKQQWRRWQETGARLFSRGNYCLDGYAMPFIFAHQFADEFQHQARHGMEATDYDALTGQWATQGTNLYLLMRLHARPDAAPDDLLAEYYSAFGAAAPIVKAYFDYWEDYALRHRTEIDRNYEDNTSRWRAWAVAAHLVFPSESFVPAEVMLAKAQTRATGDADATTRVAFLQAGLAHARLCANVSRLLTVRDPASTPERGQEALAELVAFRRAHEWQWISNFNHCAWTEDQSWRLPAETKPAVQRDRSPATAARAPAESF